MKTKQITAIICTENIITFHRREDYIRAYLGMKQFNHRRLSNVIYYAVDQTQFTFAPLYGKAGWIAVLKNGDE